jgi:hypothetical protein
MCCVYTSTGVWIREAGQCCVLNSENWNVNQLKRTQLTTQSIKTLTVITNTKERSKWFLFDNKVYLLLQSLLCYL